MELDDIKSGIERGGNAVLSSLKKFFMYDLTSVKELRTSLEEVKTEYDRARLLRVIDCLVVEASLMRKSGFTGDVVGGMLSAATAGTIARGVGYYAGFNAKLPKVEISFLRKTTYRIMGAPSEDARRRAAGQKLGAAMSSTIGRITLGLAAVAIILRAVNRSTDKLDDYTAALSVLRAEVAAIKLDDAMQPEPVSVEEAAELMAELKRLSLCATAGGCHALAERVTVSRWMGAGKMLRELSEMEDCALDS